MFTMGNHCSNILIVDDDRQIADMLVDLMKKIGFSAEAAYGGKQSLHRFKRKPFDLVITDLVMPETDGIQVLNEVKRLKPDVPVLMISGHDNSGRAVEAFRQGVYDFIKKPFEFASLEIVIHRALERYQNKKKERLFRGLKYAILASLPLWFLFGIMLARMG